MSYWSFFAADSFSDDVENVIFVAIDKGYELFISVGSIYTMTYIFEKYLKGMGLYGQAKIKALREALNQMTTQFGVLSMSKDDICRSINNENFTDIEDSYQCQTARCGGCEVLLTLNVKDFPSNTASLKIMTPAGFLAEHS